MTFIRSLNGLLFLVLTTFAVVQYDDPDFLFWSTAYGAGALWCAAAAFRPHWLDIGAAHLLLGASLVAALVATALFWPTEPLFWKQSVWWNSEAAREGMGLAMLALCLVGPLLGVWARRRAG